MWVFLISIGYYYWSRLIEGCFATKCAFWESLVNEYSGKHFPLHTCFSLKCPRGNATQVRTLKAGVNLILNCPQSHGGGRGAKRGVNWQILFGCWRFACLSLRKVDAIGIIGLQMMHQFGVKEELRAKSQLFSVTDCFEISFSCDKKPGKVFTLPKGLEFARTLWLFFQFEHRFELEYSVSNLANVYFEDKLCI